MESMARKKRLSLQNWKRTPHAELRHESLWWYESSPVPTGMDDVPTEETNRVIDVYFGQRKRGVTMQPNERDILLRQLQDLARPHENGLSARDKRYWTLEGYALKCGLKVGRFQRAFRRLEEIALYDVLWDRAPYHRLKEDALSEKQKQEIRTRYAELSRNNDFGTVTRTVSEEFHIRDWYVGKLCKEVKEQLKAQAATAQALQDATQGATKESGFIDFESEDYSAS